MSVPTQEDHMENEIAKQSQKEREQEQRENYREQLREMANPKWKANPKLSNPKPKFNTGAR